MKIQSLASHEQTPVAAGGARNVRMRMLIGPEDGAANFHMRHFEVGPGGNTPHHAHDYEHEILVLNGCGIAKTTEGDRPFQTGDVIFVPANETHAFFNTSDERCEFICLIPAPRSQTP
jgi:quercetin dioxygenase-like cupin family protein